MEQLLLHLFGDYVTQTDWMAREKVKRWFPAACHALVYTLPFLLLRCSWLALAVIGGTHYLIDRYRLAVYVIYFKNWLTDRRVRWVHSFRTGYTTDAPDAPRSAYPPNLPPFMAVWLLIIADNTIHLIVNYSAIRWF